MSKLIVELYGTELGTISQDKSRFSFEVNQNVFEKYSLSSTIMSLAVPLNLRYTAKQKKRANNFFAELLPEGRNFDWLMQSLPRDERTHYGMLRKYGKDIAGALAIYDSDDQGSSSKPIAEPIDGKGIRYLLEHMPQAALGNAPISGRTSLGGVQGKILLARIGTSWHRVHNGYPSTHIIKPIVPEYPTMIYDEAFCMRMAYDSKLTGHPVWVDNFDGVDALVIERYDRLNNTPDTRLHQEDFNQALGVRGSEKYQEYGGKVSAKRIAQTLEQFGDTDDVKKFASQLVFAIAIGNLDMHAKNVSVLHFPDESIALAPTYDQVPLCHQNTDGKLALAVNGKYFHASISQRDIIDELTSWRCRGFSDEGEIAIFVKNRLRTYSDVLDNSKLDDRAYSNLKTEIMSTISKLNNN
jgi:serine/threonine-protein kinase HipA